MGVLVVTLSSNGSELYCFLYSESDKVALANLVSQWERSMPAASRKGNNSGPLVFPDGQETGQGPHGLYYFSRRRCSASKAGRRVILLLSTQRNIIRMVSLLSDASYDRGRTKSIVEDAVDDAYHRHLPHEAQVMLLILQLKFSHYFRWTAAYESDGGSGRESIRRCKHLQVIPRDRAEAPPARAILL